MSLEDTLRVINEMQDAGVIGRYAIGGAVAAFLYIEPGTTFDLDVFIAWEAGANGLLSLGPIYSFLMGRGYSIEGEAIMVEGWAVQFLPPGNALIEEALSNAKQIEIAGVPTCIFTQEHLMAICVQTGRPKDLARLVQFLQEGSPDQEQFTEILNRHDLMSKWETFLNRFFPDNGSDT